jgi:hypothetical protein
MGLSQIEQSIVGIWIDDNNRVWHFNKIEQNERTGTLMVSDLGNPTPGQVVQYEINWVNDDKMFIDIILPSMGIRYQHQFWVDSKYLKIDLSKYQQVPKSQYLLLNKG